MKSKKQEQDNRARNDFSFPKEWTMYGPVDPAPDFAGMSDVPAELTVGGRQLAEQKAVFTDNRLDLGALLGGKAVGKTAYLLATVTAERDLDATFGAGADWWMKWWVNGAVVCDTMRTGNVEHPPRCTNHLFTVRLRAGRNLVAVEVKSGGGSFALAAGGPRELRAAGRSEGVLGDCVFAPEWSVFGPVIKEISDPDFAILENVPRELAVAGCRLSPRPVSLSGNRLDLGSLLGGAREGRAAYLLTALTADTAMEAEFGAGADFFMKWWVNGEVVCDTLASGNGNRPPTAFNRRFTASLKPGRNLLAVKVVSGPEGFAFAACGPRELAEEDARLKAEAAKIAKEREAVKARLAKERERRPSVLVTERVADLPVVRGKEERYKDTVPDTLDLAERAALAVNSLTGSLDPARGYEAAICASLHARPAHLSYRGGYTCHPKVVQVLPEMRLMSGSTLRAEHDRHALDYALGQIEQDGIYWLQVDKNPANKDMYKVDFHCPVTNCRLMLALMERYLLDGDSRWLELTGRMADGIAAAVRWDGNRAWNATCLTRDGAWGGWTSGYNVAAGSKQVVPPDWPDVICVGLYLRSLANWYALSGDVRARKTADGLARHLMRVFDGRISDPADWSSMVAGREHGWWAGHFHTYTGAMIGLADYAVATGNQEAARCVRGFYEYARLHGIARMGFFPSTIGTLESMKKLAASWVGQVVSPTEEMLAEAARGQAGKDGTLTPGMADEGCDVGDMTYLAVLLSEHGLGDYWEDADQYVRNHLVEHQWTDRGLMAEVLAAHQEFTPNPLWHVTTDDVLDRLVGSFSSCCEITWGTGWWTQCCNANIPQGLYKAWAGIVRPQGDDGVRVNLLLNRASPWLDVDSYLPYEGKAVLKNKTARSASVRIPRWADRAAVRATVNGAKRQPVWLGNYLMVRDLRPKDVVTIEFPVVTTVERWTEKTFETTYTCEFRGNTLVDISPRGDRSRIKVVAMDDGARYPLRAGFPLYQRDHMKASRAPMKTVERYVAPRVV